MFKTFGKQFKTALNSDSFLCFLRDYQELTPTEEEWFADEGKEDPAVALLEELEKTSMTKSYKIPTLLAFVLDNTVRTTVTRTDIARSWHEFYKDSKHNQDLDCPRTPEEWDGWDDSKFSKKAFEEPVKYLAKTPFFSADKEAFSIHPKYAGLFQTNSFVEHFRDVIELRRCEYFSREKFNSTGTNK